MRDIVASRNIGLRLARSKARALPALACASLDQFPLELGNAGEHRDRQPAVRRCGIRPGIELKAALAHAKAIGAKRIATYELLTQHLGVPYSDQAARKLKRVMRRLGWRARKIRLGRETRNGYCRKVAAAPIVSQSPGLPTEPQADEAPVAGHPGDMAALWQLGLKNLRDILTLPLDVEDGPLLRAKNAAANTVLSTQTKVDENRLRAGVVDKLPELLEILREEEIKYALRRASVKNE
jgi:hypothetical protein